jgi:hypothetical protein
MEDLECLAAAMVQCRTIPSIAGSGGGVTHRSWGQWSLLNQEG